MKKINILVIVLLICTNLFSQSNSAQEPEGCTFPENFKEPKGKKSASLKMMGASVKDLKEIPDNIKADLEIYPVKWIDEVLDLALAYSPDSDQHKEKLAEIAKKDDSKSIEEGTGRINTH